MKCSKCDRRQRRRRKNRDRRFDRRMNIDGVSRGQVGMGPTMDMPIMHDSDRYDFVRDIGSGNFGVARLMRDKLTKELVAVKYIERGDKVNSFISSLHLEFLLI